MQMQTFSSNETDSQESQTLRGSFDNALTTEKNVSPWTADRRGRLRSGFFNGKNLSVVHNGQAFTATVVDSSEHGLGLELVIPLEADATVSFSGVGLQGRARVRHCTGVDDNLFRVGFHLDSVSFDNIDISREASVSDPVGVSESVAGRDSDAIEELTSDGAVEGPEDLVNLANRVERQMAGAPDAGRSTTFALASIAPRKVAETAEDQVPFETVVGSILSNPAAQPAEASKPEGLDDEAAEPAAREQRGTALGAILAAWPETRHQIERLERNVAEQHVQVAGAVTWLEQTCAWSQQVQERQTNNLASVLKFISRQQAELSTLQASVISLSKELDSVRLELKPVTQVLIPGDESKG